jgi:hypothetical protein
LFGLLTWGGGGAAELLGWLMRWTAAELISLLTRGRGAAELLSWLMQWWVTEELFDWLVWLGWSFVLMFDMSGGTTSLKSVLSTRVQCGFGGISFLCDGMLVLVVNGHEEVAFFLHLEMKLQYFEAVLSSKAA